MFFNALYKTAILAVSLSAVLAAPTTTKKAVSESIVKPTATRVGAPQVATVAAVVNGTGNVVVTNTTVNAPLIAAPAAAAVVGTTVKSTVLIFARDTVSAYSAFSGLNGYAIPYQVVAVPQAGITLPALNSSTTVGNYGAIVILSEVSYDYGGTLGFQSAITAAQWAVLFQYQVSFGVRMVRLDVFPTAEFGTTNIGGCCGAGVEQLISISNTAQFPTSGLKTGAAAGLTTQGLWHYPATISNATIATEFAQFAPATGFPTTSTAGVINNISGRQQMVWFIGFATDWSYTSNLLQHAWIHWATRGLYTGFRRVTLNTQIDDMFLESDIYSPAGTTFQIKPADLAQHITWAATVNSRLPAGSSWFMEVGHNGNGNIEDAAAVATAGQCGIGPIEYDGQIDTPLEFQKPLGTGTNLWPSSPATYPYTTTCTNLDALKVWWATPANRDAFAHVSHTFTHEDENNATYFDVYREITWNTAWLTQVGIAAAPKFSKGIIPPAITGLHNGDAIRAWIAGGVTYVVGDNTRPVLMNSQNEHWPLMTTVAANGYAGIQINPRWATNIYYNCHVPDCTVAEWKGTNVGVNPAGTFADLLAIEKATNNRHLFGLHHDPFMFHQANLNYQTAPSTTINGVTAKYSLIQAWVETVMQEYIRLVNWPVISWKHDDIGVQFKSRMVRDGCSPSLTWATNPTAKTITGVTLTTTNNICAVTIPVTVPGTVTNTQGFTTEKLGSDPLTIWVKMSGSPITFTLTTPVPF